MDFIESLYQFIIHVIEAIRGLVSFFKYGEDDDDKTVVDSTGGNQ